MSVPLRRANGHEGNEFAFTQHTAKGFGVSTNASAADKEYMYALTQSGINRDIPFTVEYNKAMGTLVVTPKGIFKSVGGVANVTLETFFRNSASDEVAPLDFTISSIPDRPTVRNPQRVPLTSSQKEA